MLFDHHLGILRIRKYLTINQAMSRATPVVSEDLTAVTGSVARQCVLSEREELEAHRESPRVAPGLNAQSDPLQGLEFCFHTHILRSQTNLSLRCG